MSLFPPLYQRLALSKEKAAEKSSDCPAAKFSDAATPNGDQRTTRTAPTGR
jgi:hypothetical protein